MDNYFRFGLCFLYDITHSTKYVYNCGKAEASDGKILWYQVGGIARFPGPVLLYFRRNYVPGKADTGKTGVDGKTEAAKVKLPLSW